MLLGWQEHNNLAISPVALDSKLCLSEIAIARRGKQGSE